VDKTPSHHEEDHLISLELGGNPRDPKNLWPEMWGTLAQSLTSRSPFPPEIVGAKAKDAVENALHTEVCAGTLTLKAVTSRICESTGHAIQRTAWVNRPQSASASFANVATFYHKLVGREDKR
jgi:hypothetical protein